MGGGHVATSPLWLSLAEAHLPDRWDMNCRVIVLDRAAVILLALLAARRSQILMNAAVTYMKPIPARNPPITGGENKAAWRSGFWRSI